MGHWPDPYHVWLSEIMLQQTTVATVRTYFARFLTAWPTVQDLAAAPSADVMAAWAGLGYYARARNLLKCAETVVRDNSGNFPTDLKTLQSLPGIGPYTAAAISAIAFDRPETVVDGNVVRVISRLFAITTPMPKARPEIERLAATLTPDNRPGDYAQAIMDLGAGICRPTSPKCAQCPWQSDCRAYGLGSQQTFPVKLPKLPKPTRLGIAYLARRADGAWLLERRPPKGLLGAMLGWPCSTWGDVPTGPPPIPANWIDPNLAIKHTFTHFHLILDLRLANVAQNTSPAQATFLNPNAFSPKDLPTVMRKAYDLAQTSDAFEPASE